MLQCVTDYGFQFVYVSFIEFKWQLETHTKGRWLGWNTRCKAISLFCVLQYPSCVCADGKNVVNCVKQTEIHHRSAMKILLNTHIKRGIEAIQKSFFNEISNDSAANIEASWEEHWEMSFEWENHRMCKHLPNESISKHDVDFEIAPNSFSLSPCSFFCKMWFSFVDCGKTTWEFATQFCKMISVGLRQLAFSWKDQKSRSGMFSLEIAALIGCWFFIRWIIHWFSLDLLIKSTKLRYHSQNFEVEWFRHYPNWALSSHKYPKTNLRKLQTIK